MNPKHCCCCCQCQNKVQSTENTFEFNESNYFSRNNANNLSTANSSLLPISGTYLSSRVSSNNRHFELRVDYNQTLAHVPSLNLLSFDVFIENQASHSGKEYIESWVLINLNSHLFDANQFTMSGTIHSSQEEHATFELKILAIGEQFLAIATIHFNNGSEETFYGYKNNTFFRTLHLEIDVCQSVNEVPLLPSFNTHGHTIRPQNIPQRILSLEECMKDSGIDLKVNMDERNIDDQDGLWSDAELHELMEDHFRQFEGPWPNWHIWGLIAGHHERPGMMGIMFDTPNTDNTAAYRQGFAVFKNQEQCNLLRPDPQGDGENGAMRSYLHTWIHEIGHTLNMPHSWEKAQNSNEHAFSWMNYPSKFIIENRYWENFKFNFDIDEIKHIHHSFRDGIIMGNNAFHIPHSSSLQHLHTPARQQYKVELLARSKRYFDFMEPVYIELRLKSLVKNTLIKVDTDIAPEFGNAQIFIQTPNGTIKEYHPLSCSLFIPKQKELKIDKIEGNDRISKELFIHYGKDGFYFDEPGTYKIKAVYRRDNQFMVSSNVLQVKIKAPQKREDEQMASDYFTYPVGMCLYLNGSESKHLQKGRDTLMEIGERYQDSLLGIRAKTTLANGKFREHKQLSKTLKTKKSIKVKKGNIKETLKLTAQVQDYFTKQNDKYLNLAYCNAMKSRIACYEKDGNKKMAKKELDLLLENLKKRGVNNPVLKEIKQSSKV